MKNLNAPIIHMRDYELKQAQEETKEILSEMEIDI